MTLLKNSNFVQAWLVLVLATVFGTALAGIQVKLGPIIEANKIEETMAKIPSLLLDPSKQPYTDSTELSIQSRVVEIEKNGIRKFYPVYDVRLKDGTMAGHVAKASGQGYADKIELLLGIDENGSIITGLFILDQKETPGLGNRILETQWRNQFVEKQVQVPLAVVKTGAKKDHEIDGISGATISSRTVAQIVNKTISDIRPHLMVSKENKKGVTSEETE